MGLIVIVAFAVFFYRAAKVDRASPVIWASLSIAVSLAAMFWLHWSLLGIILAQGLLFLGIALCRVALQTMKH